jgi:hypothetical protein
MNANGTDPELVQKVPEKPRQTIEVISSILRAWCAVIGKLGTLESAMTEGHPLN